tara:strand:- start:230 stop:442 length:213 start_codon:yes stop_codon:yes gene_type:complete
MVSKEDRRSGFLVNIIERIKGDIDELTARMVKGQYNEDQYIESLKDITDKIEQCRRDKRILEWLERKTRR